MVEKIGGATWYGDLADGNGLFKLDSSLDTTKNKFALQYDQKIGTNPEAMLGAAQSGCYSLVLSMLLGKAGYDVQQVDTQSVITVGNGPDGYGILGIKLITNAKLTGITQEEFNRLALEAKDVCLVTKALSAVEIQLEAHLLDE
jgi:lipoyl-dependent peroxiredoxin